MVGAGGVPAPVTGSVLSPVLPSLATRSSAVLVPVAAGAKRTDTVQVCNVLKGNEHPLVSENSVELVPAKVTEPMLRVAGPSFLTVTLEDALVWPTWVFANASEVAGINVAAPSAGFTVSVPFASVTDAPPGLMNR